MDLLNFACKYTDSFQKEIDLWELIKALLGAV
jgi:hypothetical protein